MGYCGGWRRYRVGNCDCWSVTLSESESESESDCKQPGSHAGPARPYGLSPDHHVQLEYGRCGGGWGGSSSLMTVRARQAAKSVGCGGDGRGSFLVPQSGNLLATCKLQGSQPSDLIPGVIFSRRHKRNLLIGPDPCHPVLLGL